MAQQSSLVLANKFSNDSISHAHALFVQRRFASDLSTLLRCSVDILYVKTIDETDHRLYLNEYEKQYLVSESRRKFSSVMKNFTRPGRLKVAFGSPAFEISKSIEDDNNVEALIIGGSEEKNAFQEFFEGDVTTSVLEGISRPAFLIGKHCVEDDYVLPMNRQITILMATDLSKEMRTTETYTVGLARRIGAKIILYHKIEYSSKIMQAPSLFPNVAYLPDLEIETLKSAVDLEITNKMERIRALGVECEPYIDFSTESFQNALCNFAKKRADLISMGSRKRTFLESLVSHKIKRVLNLARVPLLCVRTRI